MEKVKDGARQLTAGGAAGLIEVCMMQPLDLIKTRLQIGGATQYKGVADCFMKTLRHEGIPGFYKGILPPILAETPKRATKFFTFEQYRLIFDRPEIPQAFSLSLAGLLCGFTEAIVICPFEVVKVRLQSEANVSLKEQKSTATVAREIIHSEGYGTSGIYRGLTATLGRHGVWNMVYFGCYHNLKWMVPDKTTDPTGNLFGRLGLGFAVGTLASTINIPFDVAKSRIQGPQPGNVRVYHGCFQTMRLVYETEGFRALFKGLIPKIMRLGPGGGIMLVAYETVYDWLKKNT
ncbi:hypothetical protein QR680_015171 [Steinernema hermaphroditum]|uniref:Mitochondrial 2-oxodicarboxylate carrier n=1 Tax=Steinernema hermaphroditum TaxID=289476 RepID=A0AA39M5A4_9BILA|nr:hypothetical protein QR680_015171 [Steinernema hermaphroditum]